MNNKTRTACLHQASGLVVQSSSHSRHPARPVSRPVGQVRMLDRHDDDGGRLVWDIIIRLLPGYCATVLYLGMLPRLLV